LPAPSLAAVTAHARDGGFRQIELAVTAENAPALAFYRREGFAEIGYIPAGFLHEGREIDEILMMRRVV
jgi:ribosomal protein S18 acetylase RimI-like enzyme